jgi:glutamate-5-semialdehyde dehydrogenase
MLTGLGGKVDVVIPRGGKSLVERVQREARVPVFSHLEGICHCYVDASANVDAAVAVVTNAKMRRTGVCGATETVLIDTAALATHLAPLVASLAAKGCEIRGDAAVREAAQGAAATIVPATDEDWSTEYLAPVVSIAAVEGVKGAIAHIARYSSSHTESVLATDPAVVGAFFAGVDSAIVLHNASTQFADGGEFGFGAEIGIATGKMHARGPVGVEQLTTFKYLVRSRGDYSLRK